jgi:phosphatidylinositol alpha-mannosyltransferase
MRICLYTNTALPLIGGQEFVVDALARQYLQCGHQVVVLAPRPSRRWRLGDEKLPYSVVRHPRFISTRHFVEWYRWWLLRLHRRVSFDVVHAHGIYPPGYLAGLCHERLGCPLVVTSHGDDVGAARRLADPTLRRRHILALGRADALIAISRFTREGFEQLAPQIASKIIDIPNGVDMDAFAVPVLRPADLEPAIRPGEYVLFLGRLDPRKGVDVLLKALTQVRPTGEVQLVVAGDGQHRPALEAQARDCGLLARVRFLGMTLGARKTYLVQNARCLVMPTISWEGQPLVVLESFAAGRPVIASDLPGFAGLLQPGRTGWLVPPQSPHALAQALEHVFADPARAAALGAAALEIARQYSWPAIAQRHLQLYESLLARRHLGRAA